MQCISKIRGNIMKSRKRSVYTASLLLVLGIYFIAGYNTTATRNAIVRCAEAASIMEPRVSDGVIEPTGDTPTGFEYKVFDAYGGWWADAEKRPPSDGEGNPDPYDPGEDDDLLCWAATASNILEYTGWGLVGGMWDSDAMFSYFQGYWVDKGGFVLRGCEWWFDGVDPGDDSLKAGGGGNFWPGEDFNDYFHWEGDTEDTLSSICGWLVAGYGVGIWIVEINGDGSHAITVWGFNHDGTNPLGIWVADSDDSKGEMPPATNLLQYFQVAYDDDEDWWFMPNYGSTGGWYIYEVSGLEPYPTNRPVADANGPYVEDEGSPIQFIGSGSYDVDGETLQYRWDYEDDWIWDGAWSLLHLGAKTWYDDYAGTVALQVYDGHLLDVDKTTVTVNNVAPTVVLTGDTIDENDYATVQIAITDPGVYDNFTVIVDWGDGSPTETFNASNPGTTVELKTHQYLDDNPTGTPTDDYTTTVTVTDDDGGSTTETVAVTVNNVPPTPNIDSMDQPNDQFILPLVHELTFIGSFTDPGTLDTHTIEWDFGDSTTTITGTLTSTHTYSEPGNYTVTLTVTDDDTGVGTATMEVTVVDAEEAIHITNEYIQNLPDGAFKNRPEQRKKALDKTFSAIDYQLDDHKYWGVIQDLRSNVREKADGHIDGKLSNDWIRDPTAQTEICQKIDDIIAYLETFL